MSTEYPSLLRSEQMSLIQLYCPTEVAHATVQELAEMKRIEFKDLNADVNPFQRTFVGETRRLDECERRLNFLTSKIEDNEINIRPYAETQYLLEGRSGPQLIDELEPKLSEHEERVGQMTNSYETLMKRMSELEEARHVLRETATFFNQASTDSRYEDVRSSVDEANAPLLENAMEHGRSGTNDGMGGGFELEFVAGTMERARMPTFERVLWRVLRGNLYMNWAEIEEPFTDPSKPKSEGVRKAVFIIFAHGAELLDKIRRISESLGGTLYPIDASADKRNIALREINARIDDLQTVLHNTSTTRKTELVRIAESISAWWAIVRKEKIIYNTMNCFQYDGGRRTLIAEAWVPTRDITAVQLALRRATDSSGTSVPPILHEMRNAKDPPTFHRTNKFTAGFQGIIDAYGVASYEEINPGLFTTITFPFLFAVMFGDIGHGFIMALSALAFIMLEKKYPRGFGEEITDTFFFGRYIILLMGIFAMYTGFIYNDIFSLNLNLAPSAWIWPNPESEGQAVEAYSNGGVYPFGIDPAWHGADNALIFTNSLKMKMSIILGVLHMSFAICLQVPNHFHFGHKRYIIAEWLPQILFMECLFGYLVIIIIYKWTVDWSTSDSSPPNLLNTLIFMVLQPGDVSGNQLYAGQSFIQVVLLGVAGICVPWMLMAKPYLLWKDNQKIVAQGYHTVGGAASRDVTADMDEAENGNGHEMGEEHKEDHFEFGEIAVHQIIHTIEFCLGCISNTASYLRLWALSLAHAQLSEVLWEMTIKNTFGIADKFGGVLGVIAVVAGFMIWFMLTLAILITMEGLSAFLHALRLHWVESNGKHYEGAGHQFNALSFEGIDEGFY